MAERGPKTPNVSNPATGNPFAERLKGFTAKAPNSNVESPSSGETVPANKIPKSPGNKFPAAQLPSVGPEGESKTERLKRLLTNPELTGEAKAVAGEQQTYFDRRDADYPFRTEGDESISFKEARELLKQYLEEQGYPKSAIFHAVTVNVVPLQKREFDQAQARNKIRDQKPDESNKEAVTAWRSEMYEAENALRLTRSSIQLTLRTIFEFPELFDIHPETEPESGLTIEKMVQVFDTDPTANFLLDNGKHLHYNQVRKLVSSWIDFLNPKQNDPEIREALGHIKQTFVQPLMMLYIRAGYPDKSDTLPHIAAHTRKLEAERLLCLFMRDVFDNGLNKYVEAIENADTSGLPAALQPYFKRVELRTPDNMTHADREARRTWAQRFVERIPQEKLEEIEAAVVYEGNATELWQDELGNRELFVVKFMIEAMVKRRLTQTLERSTAEADGMVEQFVKSELNPVFQEIAEAAIALNELRKKNGSTSEMSTLREKINSAYGSLSERVVLPISSPVRFWRSFKPTELTEAETEEGFYDINVGEHNYEEFLTFASPANRLRDQWQSSVQQFSTAHEIHGQKLLGSLGDNAQAQVADSAEYKAWSNARGEVTEFLNSATGEVSDEEVEQLTEMIRQFMQFEEELEEMISEKFSTDDL